MSSIEVRWTENAVADLERIWRFLAAKDETAAVAAMRILRERALLLEKFPNAGRPSVDLEPEQRELRIPFGASGYVLLYRVEGRAVYVLALRHQKEAGYPSPS